MKAEPADYDRLVESLADGVPLDWAAIGEQAATDKESRRYRNLRLVARIAELHRTIALEDEPESAPADAADGTHPTLETWGHLQIVRRLAISSFGEVYVAHDPQLSLDVALKLLRRDRSGQPATARLLAEARTMAKVRHPNVVTVHGADVRDGRAGLWMELVNGRTLEDWITDNGAMGARETIGVGEDLCRALAAVHAAGLIHGDVKAQNVLREERGRIVLMDFGAGQAQGAPVAKSGTPLYLAPEVLAGAPASAQSDIYSLGVLLFHLLTNRYPVVAADIDGLRLAHARGDRVRLRDLRPDLPGPIVSTVERALEVDPSLRFPTAGAMEQALVESSAKPRPWRYVAAAAAVAALVVALPPLTRALWGPKIDSIAILPFSVPAADASAHLLTGLSTDVVRELQRFDLDVKRASAGIGSDPAVLEQRLNADATLRASSSRADGQSRLRVAVVRAGASELWSKEYALDGDTLPSLARTVAADAAAALRLRVRPGAPSAGHQASFTAYDAYQRGRALWEQRTPAALMRSLEFFKRAAELDPAYAEPWAGMADAYIALGVPAFGPLSPIEARRHSKDAALQALKIDPDLVEAHTSLAFAAYLHDWDWTAAEKGFQRALALNPQYAVAHHWYADFLTALGRFAEADAEIRRALELEPLSIIIHRDVAWHLFFQRRYADAVSHLRETLRLDPAYVPARTLLGRALVEQGEYAEALRELNEAASGRPTPALESFVAYAQARAGNKRAAEEWLAGIRRAPNAVYVSPYYLGLVRLALGERGPALDEFERAYREQDTTIVNLKADPRLDPLRQEPRYQHLIEVLRFPAR